MKERIVDIFYYIFFVAAILLVLFRMYLRSNNRVEEAETVQWVVLGLLIAAVICRFMPKLFPKWFQNSLTTEEIEGRVHNDKL